MVLRTNQCSGPQPDHETPACDGRAEDATRGDQIVWSYAPDQCSGAGASQTIRLAPGGSDHPAIASTHESVEFAREGNLRSGDSMNYTIEAELEEDGRWLAEVPQLPGVLVYGATRDEAMSRAQVLALRVIAERLEHGEASPQPINISIPA